MKGRVDEELCVGDKSFVEICPKVFEIKADVAVAKVEEVPKELQEVCKKAAEGFLVCNIDAFAQKGGDRNG